MYNILTLPTEENKRKMENQKEALYTSHESGNVYVCYVTGATDWT